MKFKYTIGDTIGAIYQDKHQFVTVVGFYKSEPEHEHDAYLIQLDNGEVTWILPSEVLTYYSNVRIVRATDDTTRQDLIGQKGTIIGINDNELTGNTEEDPLFTVITETDEVDQFWLEELIQIRE